jgi:SGNH domain (fused to AT3 domains)
VLAVLVLATTYISSIDDREMHQRLQADNSSVPAWFFAPQPVLVKAQAAATGAGVSQLLPAVMHEVRAGSSRRGVPAALNPPVGQLLEDRHYGLPPDCSAHDGETTHNICRLGASSSSRAIVVIGDSHAEMWMPAILSLAQRDGWAVTP